MAIGIGIGLPFVRRRAGGASNTPRTSAFLTATGITDATIISALNAMDTSLISAGLLPAGTGAGKIKALYPIVGGTAATHKFNFVNPLDTDAAFRLTFFGGWTHSATGALPNGTNAYADTFLNVNSDLINDDLHLSFYSRTNNQTPGYEYGIDDSKINIICRYASSSDGYLSYSGYNPFLISGNSQGLYALSFKTNSLIGYKNSTKVVNATKTAITLPNKNLLLGCDNRVTLTEFSSKQCAFSTIGLALNDAEMLDLNTINLTFQTTLGRQV